MTDRPVLLMTRPQAASERFLDELARDGITGFRSIISPLFDIHAMDGLPDLSGVKGLIFTSAHGVESFRQMGGPPDLPCYTVGPATAEAARTHGMTVYSSRGSADDLQNFIFSKQPDAPLMHLHGVHVSGDLAQALTGKGVPTRAAAIYDQHQNPLNKTAIDALNSSFPVVIPLFSPRSGRLLTCTLGEGKSLLIAAMSEMVAKSVPGIHIRGMCIAQTPDSASLRICVAQLLQKARSIISARDVQGLEGAQASQRIER